MAYELARRGGEAARCQVNFFKEEKKADGMFTNRIEYNPIFSKTCQGGAQKCSDSKWLVQNITDQVVYPVRLFRKLLQKRGLHIKIDRLFLTVNRYWDRQESVGWYTNMPIGVNELAKWTKLSAERIGLNINECKITNH